MRALASIAAGLIVLVGLTALSAPAAEAHPSPGSWSDRDLLPFDAFENDLPVPFERLNLVPFDAFENDLPVPFERFDLVPFDRGLPLS